MDFQFSHGEHGQTQETAAPVIGDGRKAVDPYRFHTRISDRTILAGRVKIPKKFIDRYGKDLKFLANFKVLTHCRFDVSYEKYEGGVYFGGGGFKEFLLQYGLEAGSLIQFVYEGEGLFRVRTYDKDGCETEYPMISGYCIQDEYPDYSMIATEITRGMIEYGRGGNPAVSEYFYMAPAVNVWQEDHGLLKFYVRLPLRSRKRRYETVMSFLYDLEFILIMTNH